MPEPEDYAIYETFGGLNFRAVALKQLNLQWEVFKRPYYGVLTLEQVEDLITVLEYWKELKKNGRH